jgi:hypothetical protein
MNQLWQFGSKSEEEINAEIEENVSNNTKNTRIICFEIKNPPPVELCWQKKRNS